MAKKLLALDDRGGGPQQLALGAGLTVTDHTISADGGAADVSAVEARVDTLEAEMDTAQADIIAAQADADTGIANAATALTAGKLEHVELAASDETTVIEAGVGKIKKRIRWAGTLTAVYAELGVAHTSGLFTVDINKNGSTVLSTKITLDANERDSATAAAPPVISDSSWAAHDEISVDVDVAGGGSPAGLKVTLVFARA